jgi:hypothetical protein
MVWAVAKTLTINEIKLKNTDGRNNNIAVRSDDFIGRRLLIDVGAIANVAQSAIAGWTDAPIESQTKALLRFPFNANAQAIKSGPIEIHVAYGIKNWSPYEAKLLK